MPLSPEPEFKNIALNLTSRKLFDMEYQDLTNDWATIQNHLMN